MPQAPAVGGRARRTMGADFGRPAHVMPALVRSLYPNHPKSPFCLEHRSPLPPRSRSAGASHQSDLLHCFNDVRAQRRWYGVQLIKGMIDVVCTAAPLLRMFSVPPSHHLAARPVALPP